MIPRGSGQRLLTPTPCEAGDYCITAKHFYDSHVARLWVIWLCCSIEKISIGLTSCAQIKSSMYASSLHDQGCMGDAHSGSQKPYVQCDTSGQIFNKYVLSDEAAKSNETHCSE